MLASTTLVPTAEGATKSVPYVIEIKRTKTFDIRLLRRSRLFSGQVTIKVYSFENFLLSGSYRYELNCTATKMLGGPDDWNKGVDYRIHALIPNGEHWRVEIYDNLEGGPTGERPYTVDYDIRAESDDENPSVR